MSEPKIVRHGGGAYLVIDVTSDVDLTHAWHRYNISAATLQYEADDFRDNKFCSSLTYTGKGTTVWRELEEEAKARNLRSD